MISNSKSVCPSRIVWNLLDNVVLNSEPSKTQLNWAHNRILIELNASPDFPPFFEKRHGVERLCSW